MRNPSITFLPLIKKYSRIQTVVFVNTTLNIIVLFQQNAYFNGPSLPQGNAASASTTREQAPNLPSGDGGGLVYGGRRDGSGPTGLGMGLP